ncbi:MAG: beta-propeller domain-containing protein [Candidatus Pacebacteria bacterium]|nr:beta-propeller domain-containing protein [Candidatus Paceibacterota bacterium]
MNFVIDTKRALIIVAVAVVLALGTVMVLNQFYPNIYFPALPLSWRPFTTPANISEMKGFASEEEFKAYLHEAQANPSGANYSGLGMGLREDTAITAAPKAAEGTGVTAQSAPDRVSGTNVQVLGIDEPDIVKTDGQQIYFSKNPVYYWGEPRIMSSVEGGSAIMPPKNYDGAIKIIKALPATELSVIGKIDQQGEMLLSGNNLVVFSGEKIVGYDVSDPKNPTQKWSFKLDYRDYLITSRLKDGKLYLVLRNDVNQAKPCPLKPIILENGTFEIKCQDIYHPTASVPIDSTFTVLMVDPSTGQIANSISFVGSSGQSVIYMSGDNLYLTYSYNDDLIKFYYNFLSAKAHDIVPLWMLTKLQKLMDYDLSFEAKMTEFSMIMNNFQNSLNEDEQLKVSNELVNRFTDYQKEHQRELEKTGIAKISLASLKVAAVGNVPGHPLNQFSLDEYDGHLRIAVTVGGRGFGWGYFWSSQNESVNDVYVLNAGMKAVGSVLGLGQGEKIYSARFLGNQGYVVTFKETDPFYVLDLSDPQKPVQTGELKIPGYSAYLHPLADNRILGVGKEGQQVKLSLFDVKDPSNSKEIAKYTLDEYWSEILNTHHAFLQDAKNQVFFMPGSKGGYVFSYKDDQLSLAKAVSGVQAKRALYINDYLYIIGDNQIIVLNEKSWEKVKELEL